MDFLFRGAGARPGEPFPLTDIQQAYLAGRHPGLELGGGAAHSCFEFDCTGLDLPRLSRALDKVIGRHDALRTVVDGEDRQRVLDRVPAYEIAVRDLSERLAEAQAAELAAVRAELGTQIRDAGTWPLFDIRATVLPGGRTRLHLSLDHLFVDLRGFFAMFADWQRHYENEDLAADPPELPFRAYVLDRQRAAESEEGERAREYWLSRLDELPPGPELPLAVAPEQVGTPEFIRLGTSLDSPRWSALAAAAASRGLSPDAVLLAAYREVVRAWSNRPDFTVTLTLLDRCGRKDSEVGNFVSPSLFAVSDVDCGTFAERAAAVQQRLAEDRRHTAFSGIRVLRELVRRRHDSRAVAVPVVFSSLVEENSGADVLHAFGEPVHGASQTPQIWLENQVLLRDGGLAINWNAVAGLFPDGMLDAMLGAYRSVLARLADDPGSWDRSGRIVQLPPEAAAEQAAANQTAAELPPAALHELVARTARRTPDAVAVIADGAETTYRELTAHAHRLARRLRDAGEGKPNTVVAVSMRPGAGLIAALLGILHAGAAYVSIDPDLPEQRRHKLLSRCAATAVITDPELRDGLAWPSGLTVVTAADAEVLAQDDGPLDRRQGCDDLAYVIFTSGSTGEPKGVMISHRSAANTVQDINQRFGVTAADRVLAMAPTGFDLSVYDVFGVLGAGGAMVVPEPGKAGDAGHWTELIDRHRVTIWNSVPAPMRLWTDSLDDAPSGAGASLRLALLSGDWIPVTLPGRIRDRLPGMEVVSLGGATEASIWSVFHRIREVALDRPSIPYGKPLANQTLHIHDEHFDPCPTWVTGEIHIGGVGVAIGYWGDPERTAERFVTHPRTGERLYRTGDLGRYLPGGDIEILGRTDFQVKINGYRVELGEIEAALAAQPGIRQVLVDAPVSAAGQRQLAAYLIVDDPGAADPAKLRPALAETLPGYMVPHHFVAVDAFPLTGNGKIDRAALPRPWHGTGEPQRDAARGDEVESGLVRIWAEQLGHTEIGVEEGFFDVGGDSLHAMAIVRRLRAEFGIGDAAEQEVIEGLFTNATIAEFADVIRSLVDGRR
ncbi:non-ribosomal peptide synthetase [Amycolatopsis silviterrae]|uniref:Phenyloxazoline synthase MbtB n=1 Tax=Amycolatopsis silviterrae TaxID=1656914 RepID=A0ABW5HJF7_9PSEU